MTGGGRAGTALALRLSLSGALVVSLVGGALVLSLLAGAPASGAAGPLPNLARFEFELQAQNHCRGEAVVWVDARSRTYDTSTDRFYGHTSAGAFVCQGDAERAGYRAGRG